MAKLTLIWELIIVLLFLALCLIGFNSYNISTHAKQSHQGMKDHNIIMEDIGKEITDIKHILTDPNSGFKR